MLVLAVLRRMSQSPWRSSYQREDPSQNLGKGKIYHVAHMLERTLDSLPWNRVTDSDGRCSTLLPSSPRLEAGTYKMIFQTGTYFAGSGRETFYPVVEVSRPYHPPGIQAPDYLRGLIRMKDHLPSSESRATLSHPIVTEPMVIHHLSWKLESTLRCRSDPSDRGRTIRRG